ncbi:hypothetical protein IWW55_006894 [Coemansia sp. RSA 2706]|nr:hypothetical protein LPJ70_001165 [Coemansia sp. RSA 2708]KAJ2286748.1 hypothetical protein IWW55_006894 [Coemansia sp. RSA 2706]KAJ2312481.1 hypothetical protein IWW51_006255 [Coemansia sp. RSA 2702]KAJ2365298.1 hypothetical protein H4S01_003320 [Coemansia sp. RSA 2610]KAJ2387151.1 hypothetical protein H4S02_003497 [Coemansia sp. RSA 2611]
MKLEEKLAKWAEREDDADGDYGLIIDDSVTAEGPPRATPFPPQFTKAGSCSQLARPALLPANMRALGRGDAAGRAAQDVLQRFSEADDSDYDDLVLPEEAELLDRQLAEWKTPGRRPPSWPNGLGNEAATPAWPSGLGSEVAMPLWPNEVTMSGATAVEGGTPTTASQPRALRRPMLIKNVAAAEPVVLGAMRFDPVGRVWRGNDAEAARFAGALAESERQLGRGRPLDTSKLAHRVSQRAGNPGQPPSPPAALAPGSPLAAPKGRPALIPPSAALAEPPASPGRARPIFDPQNLRWIDPNETRLDPLWNIAELPVEPSPIDAVHFPVRLRSASEAIGGDAPKNCFVLSDEQIEAYHRESIDYESFARHWFPKSAT